MTDEDVEIEVEALLHDAFAQVSRNPSDHETAVAFKSAIAAAIRRYATAERLFLQRAMRASIPIGPDWHARHAASGIETEGHDREDGHGAKHESPTR